MRSSTKLLVAFVIAGSLVAASALMARAEVKTITIDHDGGGAISPYMANVIKYSIENTKVVLRGNCWSACTLYTSLKGFCAEPSGSLHFHAPYQISRTKQKVYSKEMTETFMDLYPIKIREFIEARGGLARDWIHLVGPSMYQFVSKCKDPITPSPKKER